MNRSYQLQQGEPYWMPEIGLGIGRVRGEMDGIDQEWLAWHDQSGTPYPLPAQVIERERQRADQAEQRADQAEQRADQAEQRADQAEQRADQERLEKLQLLEKLRQLGIDPDQL